MNSIYHPEEGGVAGVVLAREQGVGRDVEEASDK